MAAESITRGMVLTSPAGATYRFDPGALCLELLTTGGPGAFARYETLHAPADLLAWAARSRLTPTPALDVTAEALAEVRRTRDALWRTVIERSHGRPAAPGDLAVLNGAAAPPPLIPAVGPDGARRWAGPADGRRLLSTVARDAVDLLTGPWAHRIRTCAADDCHLVYVDTSRPGRRRWCSMEHCGNRHKVRSLRARRGDGPAPED